MSRLASAGPAATRGQCNQPFVIAPAGTSRCRRMNATTGLIVSRASDSDGGVESDWMHGTARCFGYPSDSSPTARQQAPWTLPAETDLLLRLRRRPSASPPSSCLAGRSRARCHAGRVTGPGPGSGPLPLASHAGPVGPARAGTSHAESPWGSVRAGGANCVLPPPRAGGSCPASAPSGVQPGPHAGVEDRHRTAPLGPGASRRASRGGALLGPTLPDADRRLRPPRASCRESRVSTGPRAGAPERHGAAQPGTGAVRRGPRRSAHVGRGRHPRSACGSKSQPERHCRASPGTGEVAAGPSPSMQSGPGDYPP